MPHDRTPLVTSKPPRASQPTWAWILRLGAFAMAWTSAATLLAQAPGKTELDPSELELVEYVGAGRHEDAWSEREVEALRGRVKQFDADKLIMTQPDGSDRTVDSPQISRIVPHWQNDSAQSTHQLLVEKRYQEVTKAVPAALNSNLVRWQQRLLIADLIQAEAALGNQTKAATYFLSLARSQAPPLLYNVMPLCWTSEEPGPELVEAARKWLATTDDNARLLGASWLLFGDESSSATQALKQLQGSQNSAIAQMAIVQSWRLVPPPQTRTELPSWFEFRDHLLPPLQLGPTEFIADRLMRIGEMDLAIGQWMRIAKLHPEQYHRASAALEMASKQLKRAGREEEAQRLEPWILQLRGHSPSE